MPLSVTRSSMRDSSHRTSPTPRVGLRTTNVVAGARSRAAERGTKVPRLHKRHEGSAGFDGIADLRVHGHHGAALMGDDFVHHLHGLDERHDLTVAHNVAG